MACASSRRSAARAASAARRSARATIEACSWPSVQRLPLTALGLHRASYAISERCASISSSAARSAVCADLRVRRHRARHRVALLALPLQRRQLRLHLLCTALTTAARIALSEGGRQRRPPPLCLPPCISPEDEAELPTLASVLPTRGGSERSHDEIHYLTSHQLLSRRLRLQRPSCARAAARRISPSMRSRCSAKRT